MNISKNKLQSQIQAKPQRKTHVCVTQLTPQGLCFWVSIELSQHTFNYYIFYIELSRATPQTSNSLYYRYFFDVYEQNIELKNNSCVKTHLTNFTINTNSCLATCKWRFPQQVHLFFPKLLLWDEWAVSALDIYTLWYMQSTCRQTETYYSTCTLSTNNFHIHCNAARNNAGQVSFLHRQHADFVQINGLLSPEVLKLMESTELEIETPPPASIGGEIDDSVMKETRSYSFIIN